MPGWSRCVYPRCAGPGPPNRASSLGTARLDRRTKRLVGRLRPGDIAVIDHVDLDRVAADSLVAVGVAAVLNAKPSVSGRYPNLGPEVLVSAGIPLIDDLGEDVFEQHPRGRRRPDRGQHGLRSATSRSRTGSRQDAESVAKAMADAREGLSVQLEAFAANTMEYLKQERDLLLDGVGVPDDRDPDRGPALPDRGARLRLQGRPGRAAARTSGSSSRC